MVMDAEHKRFKTDIVIKRILRAFRFYLKKQYQEVYSRRYYYWVPATLKRMTRAFYHGRYGIVEQDYKENENALILLIHNTKTLDEIKDLTKTKSRTVKKDVQHLKDTFGQKPNIINLKAFFKIDIIQKLWFRGTGYRHS